MHGNDYARAGRGIGVLGHCQLRLRGLFVVAQTFEGCAVAGEAGRQDAVGWHAESCQHFVGDEFLVYGKVQGAAEVDIVERRFASVEADVCDAEAGRRNLQLGGERLLRVFQALEVEDADARDVYLVVLI